MEEEDKQAEHQKIEELKNIGTDNGRRLVEITYTSEAGNGNGTKLHSEDARKAKMEGRVEVQESVTDAETALSLLNLVCSRNSIECPRSLL